MNHPPKSPAPRRYGFACLMCRRRKIKCDGKKPNCANCIKAKEICSYKESPSYNAHLVHQLQRSKRRIDELEGQLRDLAGLDSEERDRRLAEISRDFDHLSMADSSPSGMTDLIPARGGAWHGEFLGGIPIGGATEHALTCQPYKYYGATSRFHPLEAADSRLLKVPGPDSGDHKASEEYHRKWLAANSKFQESLEHVAIKNLEQYTDVPLDICAVLLQIYWTWQAPLHSCVYRRCFYRDLALGGPYCSAFLLNVIFAHACRHTKDDDPKFAGLERGKHFMNEAKQLLLLEMEEEKPRIPTIQGLLILGGRQCAIGKNSEGWLYTGMAIRMVTDLGLHLYKGNLEGLEGLDPDDLEVRKRLYLSAYIWDKSISLCLGRPPSLVDLPYSPDSLFDTSDNDLEWRPFYLKEAETSYPFTKSSNTLHIVYFGKLARIINEAYDKVYSQSLQNLKLQSISELEAKLRSFHASLPDQLRIQAPETEHPIPHYANSDIPPFLRVVEARATSNTPLALRAHQVCIEEANNVNEHFRRYGRTFNFQNQTYLVSYCVYTAATIDIQEIRQEDPALAQAAANRLSTTLKMLETEAKQTPGIKRSIEIIKSHLAQQTEDRSQKVQNPLPARQVQINREIRQQLLPPPTPLYPQAPSYSESTLSTPPSQGPRESPLLGRHSNMGVGRLPPHPGVSGGIDPAKAHQLVEQEPIPEENIGSLMHQAMDVDNNWNEWEFFNAGGGFVPDTGGWAPFDPSYPYNNMY
ncbi:hypothetical protein N7468_004039 [Penicillium chermesinum]|uniref:Zn(2)-C6 fungal-type domain-containing protein n=1 Tax=Penicillium chermesinum TaxID=63820 RepID=A0A9W9P7Q9_9EURO|nr:uncharacterized protein N7468_004039 [Penicillium chermesinum]KAJ5239420.1 hypothetical protein N7468_004039 [Penicillium chermesinum]